MISFNEGEEVVLEARRHWIVVLPIYIVLVLLSLAPVALYAVIDALPIALETTGWGPALLAFAYSGWMLALWVGGYFAWLDYHLDIWIVTTERVIDVEQKGFFRRETSSLRYDRIQDITAEVDGVLATFLKFGDVRVQNAGEAKEFVIANIANPQLVVDTINAELARRGRIASIVA
jgi:uncharacterized membrane protein YdbT with pleckstrin-like domain